MRFEEKLDKLMRIYRMNNVTLARGVGADASLVSRWRTGSRAPSARSGAPGDIGAFLAGASILPVDLAQLHQLLGRAPEDTQTLAEAITAWLKADNIISFRAAPAPLPPEQAAGYMSAAPAVGSMAKILNTPPPEGVGPVNLWPYVQRGNPADHEVFSGESGKRKAVLSFLHKLQNSPRALDIFIMTGETHAWITNDASFSQLWPRCLLSMLQRGHRIHIVIPAPELPSAMKTWLSTALFYTSQCRVYAVPGRALDTLMAAQGYGAVMSFGVGPSEESTMLFSGVLDSSVFEAVFHNWLRGGFPVLQTCDASAQYADRLLALEGREGTYYQARGALGALYLSEDELRELLFAHHIPDASVCVNRVRARREAMTEFLRGGGGWIEILPKKSLSAASYEQGMTLDGGELGLTRDVTVTKQMLKSMLSRLCSLLERHKNLHFILPETEPLPIQIMYKARSGAYFTIAHRAGGAEGRPAAVYLGQPDALGALEEWFCSMTYDRAETLKLLRSAAYAL
ncbi:MAG: hypothetical protein LBR85_08220 [Oscillospiraceae bacterium]|nr:hypothetical protein [Oscillospiraceae bacterium]